MKIKEIKVENFRKHKIGSINFGENELSILVGNNNSGKSTFINAIKKVVKDRSFTVYDFYEGEKSFVESIKNVKENAYDSNDKMLFPHIMIRLSFKIETDDNKMYAKLLSELDDYVGDNDEFAYQVTFSAQNKQNGLIDYIKSVKDISTSQMLKVILKEYYGFTYELGNNLEMENIKSNKIFSEIINLRVLEANLLIDQNSYSGKNSKIGNSLLNILSMVVIQKPETVKSIQEALSSASDSVKKTYEADLKSNLIEIFQKFGYKNDESGELKIDLDIVSKDILSSSFKTFLTLGDSSATYDLPDNNNGLGYNNLLLTLVEIYSFISGIESSEYPINLLCIEEPETHMHPEMERKFIERISVLKDVYLSLFESEKKLIRAKKIDNSLQIIMTTHSPNIVSNANYKDLIFIKDSYGIGYESLENDDTFAIQYLTIEKTDALFSHNIILVEGDVERILIPYFIKKLNLNNELYSVVQIDGTHFEKFKNFYEKIGAKVLIVTDLDLKDRSSNVSSERKEKQWKSSKRLKNSDKYDLSSNHFLLEYFNRIYCEDEMLKIMDIAHGLNGTKNNTKVVTQKILEQDEQSITVGRTFEEQFILENSDIIFTKFNTLDSIKNYNYFSDQEVQNLNQDVIKNNAHGLYRFIERNNKKTAFTFDLIKIIDENDFNIPEYIREGIEWLLK